MNPVFLKYIDRETGAVFFHAHYVENHASFHRQVRKLTRELGRDAKCDAQIVSESTYHAGKDKVKRA